MSKIQVDVISDADDKGLNTVDKSLRDLGKSAQQVARETEKGAQLAAGSYAKLRGELVSNKKALEHLEVGSDAFKEQATVVAELEDKVGAAKKSISQLTKAGEGIKGISQHAVVASNSVEGITLRLKEANNQLKRTERGSDAYKKHATEVDKLTKELDDANKEMKEFTGQRRGVDGVAGSLNRLESELEDNVRQLRKLRVGTTEFKKQKLVVDKLTRSIHQSKAALNGRVGSRVEESVRQFAGSITGFTAVAGGLAATAKLIMGELDDLKRRDAESKVAIRTREQSIAKLVQNAGAELTDKIVERAEATAAVTGADADKLISISSSVASAGITDEKVIVDTAATGLRSQGGDVGSGDAIAGAAVDLASTLEISIKDAFGVLFQAAGTARPKDIAQLGQAAVKSTAALTGAGISAEKATEKFAAFTLLTGDTTGERGVSISNDLTQAFRTLKQKGVPEEIEVGGKKVKVKLPEEVLRQLQDDALSSISLDEVEQLSRQSKGFEQVFESFLPNSQNREFTQQIVGGSAAYDAKLAQAANAINLGTAGQRATGQVAAVEGRRPIGVLTEVVDAALDRNLQDTTAALKATARETFTKVQERANNLGVDFVADWTSEKLADARELAGQGVAGARAGVLRNDVERGKVGGKDVETYNAAILVLDRIQKLIQLSESGRLSATSANKELSLLRELLKGLSSSDTQLQLRAQRQAESQPQIMPIEVNLAQKPSIVKTEAIQQPTEAADQQALANAPRETVGAKESLSPYPAVMKLEASETLPAIVNIPDQSTPAQTASRGLRDFRRDPRDLPPVTPNQQPASGNTELLREVKAQRVQAAQIAKRQAQAADQQTRLLAEALKPKVQQVKNVDAGPVERDPAMAGAL